MLNEDPVDLQFNQSGYLFLASEDTAHIMEENYRTQRSAPSAPIHTGCSLVSAPGGLSAAVVSPVSWLCLMHRMTSGSLVPQRVQV